MNIFDHSRRRSRTKRAAWASLAAALLLGVSAPVLAQPTPDASPVPQGAMGSGTETRMWADAPLPEPAKPTPYAITVTEHVKVPMRDGTLLDGVLYVPDRAEPAGCILIFDGYGWSLDPRDRRFAEEQGYGVLNVSTRGISQSEGVPALYDTWHEDGWDTVEWMADQPWCADGNVGMFGSSLPGNANWQVADALPPALKAIAPDVACANCYQTVWHPGGTLLGPGRESRAGHEYEAVAQHPNRDEWWEKHIVDPAELAAIANTGMGFMITGSLQDFITVGSIDAFATVQAVGGNARLMVDYGGHSSARRNVLGPYHHATHMDQFFGHFLRGEENAWTDSDNYKTDVLLYIMGPNQYRWETTWPIADASNTVLYLRAQASGTIQPPEGSNTAVDDPNAGRFATNDGSLSLSTPAADERPMRYTYFPENGPFLATGWTQRDGWPKVDQTEFETKAVSWTTDAMTGPTEVTGNIVFDFSASSTAGDTDFVMMVTDVAPDGTSQYISAGYLNAPRYPDLARPNPMMPGEVRRFRMVLNPTAYVFQPGHRIRFSLAGGATPLPIPGQTGAEIPGKNANYSNVTIYQDAANPATLTIPVIGTGQLVAAAK
jgi:predicted acyl esterase